MDTASRVLPEIEMNGSLKFAGGMLFEGRFKGGQIEGDALVVGTGAEIQANIKVEDLTILGRVEGDVEVSGKCQLRATAELHGNLKTVRVAMDDGATFTGGMEISRAGAGGAKAGK